MIDSHCHLEQEATFFDLNKVIADSKAAGLKALVTNSAAVKDKEKTLEIINTNKGFVFACFGLHPYESKSISDKDLEAYAEWLKEKSKTNVIQAIGEVGLDNILVHQVSHKKRCSEVFSFFIDLSKELRLPLVLHCREAYPETLKLLGDRGAKDVAFHYFGAKDFTKIIMEQGWHISIPYTVAIAKKMGKIMEDAETDKIMAETDSPIKLSGEKIVYPTDVKKVVERMAQEKKVPFEEMDRIVDENVSRFYNLPKF